MPAAVESAVARLRNSYLTGGVKADSSFDPNEAAALIKSVGGTDYEARMLSRKIVGESGGRPEAVGHDPGGTTGLGLWQLTTGVGNDDLIAKHGGPKAMLRPKPNARAALDLFRGGGGTESTLQRNWYAGDNPPGDPSLAAMTKPRKKDIQTIRAAGLNPKKIKQTVLNAQPFASGASPDVTKLINPKWDPDSDGHGLTILPKGISPVVKKWARKYDVTVGEAKAESGHVSPGHLVTGTATDLYPRENTPAGWDKLEKGLKVLETQGFEIGYGTNGVGQAWSNHGRGNHAHVEWVGQGSSTDAIKKLGGLTNAQVAQLEAGAGGGGGLLGGGSLASGGSVASGGRTTAEEAPPAPISTFQRGSNPLSARATLPAGIGELLSALQGGEPATEENLAGAIRNRERFRPRRGR
jgi:hypothetical protein